MELSEEQVEMLFAFAKKKHVHWYDLQFELVDHLAVCIEEKMEADTRLSFTTALEQVYKSFGIFGFWKIVENKTESLQKNNKKLWWAEVKMQFCWPLILKSLSLYLIIYTSSKIWEVSWVYLFFFFSISGWIILRMIFIFHQNKTKEKLLLLSAPGSYSSWGSSISFWIMIQIALNFDESSKLQASPFLVALLLTSFFVLNNAALIVRSHLYKKARANFPAAFA